MVHSQTSDKVACASVGAEHNMLIYVSFPCTLWLSALFC